MKIPFITRSLWHEEEMSPAMITKVLSKRPTNKVVMVTASRSSTAFGDKPVFSPVFILATLASATSQRNDNRSRNKTTETNTAGQRRVVISAGIILVIVLKSWQCSMGRRWVGLARLPCVTVTCRKKATHADTTS